MSGQWTIEQLIEERHKAERKAKSWFRVIFHLQDIDVTPRWGLDGDIYIDMKPIPYTTLSATARCPRWAKTRFDGLKYQPDGKENKSDKPTDQFYLSLRPVIAAILRRGGYNGYIQLELPF